MSQITEYAQNAGIDNPSEVATLEHFFENPEIQTALEEAEKYRIRRYMVLIPSVVLVAIWLTYLGSLWVIQVEIGDSGKYRPSDMMDGVWWSFIWGFIIFGIIVKLFHSKIEWAIKQKVLTKLSKELYSRLDYDSEPKFAFWDLMYLRSKWFLNSYDSIDTLEDSIWLSIEEDRKFLIAQGYELQTSEVRQSGKKRRRVTTNHCYLLKVRFPLARIPLANTLFIRSDESDTLINGSLKYALLGGIIWLFIGTFLSWAFNSWFLVLVSIVIGALIWYFLRKRQRNSKRVVLENMDFEKLYDVECADQIGSRMIITPSFMDRLVQFAQKSKHKFEFIYEADCFYIKWNLSGAYLEVNTWKKLTVNIATYINWYGQMKEILSFIFDMRLLYFSKTNPDSVITPELKQYVSMSEGQVWSAWKWNGALSSLNVFGSFFNIWSLLRR